MEKLSAGFAGAVQPIVAETAVRTDTADLESGEVDLGEIPGYRALPARSGKFPIVLVVHEIFGLHEYIKEVCRRFAKTGYFAIAPNLYARQGDVSKIEDTAEIRSRVVSKVPDQQVMCDLDAAVVWAEHSGKGHASRLAMTGFSWGGRIAWL